MQENENKEINRKPPYFFSRNPFGIHGKMQSQDNTFLPWSFLVCIEHICISGRNYLAVRIELFLITDHTRTLWKHLIIYSSALSPAFLFFYGKRQGKHVSLRLEKQLPLLTYFPEDTAAMASSPGSKAINIFASNDPLTFSPPSHGSFVWSSVKRI